MFSVVVRWPSSLCCCAHWILSLSLAGSLTRHSLLLCTLAIFGWHMIIVCVCVWCTDEHHHSFPPDIHMHTHTRHNQSFCILGKGSVCRPYAKLPYQPPADKHPAISPDQTYPLVFVCFHWHIILAKNGFCKLDCLCVSVCVWFVLE